MLQPSRTSIRSFCWTPAGVSMTRLVPPTSAFVVDDRSVIGVVFFSVTVTVQLGVPLAGRSAMMCATPAAAFPATDPVAVFCPVAPASGWTASALSCVCTEVLPTLMS